MPFKFTTLPTSHFSRQAAADAAAIAIAGSDYAEWIIEEVDETVALLAAANVALSAAQHASESVTRAQESVTLSHTVANLLRIKTAEASAKAAMCALYAAQDTTQFAASASAALSEAITIVRGKRSGAHATNLLAAQMPSALDSTTRFSRDDGLASVNTKLGRFRNFNEKLTSTVGDMKEELNVIDHRIIDTRKSAAKASRKMQQITQNVHSTLQRTENAHSMFLDKIGPTPFMDQVMDKASIVHATKASKYPLRASFAQNMAKSVPIGSSQIIAPKKRIQDGFKLPPLRKNTTQGPQKGTILYKPRF